MAIEYVGGKTGQGTSADFSVALDDLTGGLDTKPSAGDFIIVGYGGQNGSGRAVYIVNGGYTKLFEGWADAARDFRHGMFYRRANGTETSVTIPGSGNAGWAVGVAVQVWRGVDENTPIEVWNNATGINNRAMDAPPITPITQGAMLSLFGGAVTTSAFNSTQPPSGWTNRLWTSFDPGTAVGVGMASQAWDGVTSPVNPGIWTGTGGVSGDSWGAAVLVLRPAPDVVISGTMVRNYEGGAWSDPRPLMAHDGTDWVPATLRQWNGTDWVDL